LIRRFQTPAEREAEGRLKGYSGTLEADLWRSEAKVAALHDPNASLITYKRGPEGEILPEEDDEKPKSKDEARQRWEWEMRMRFLKGDDGDFDYEAVDSSEAWDDRTEEEREAEEKWFGEEEPAWVGEGVTPVEEKLEVELKGQTGIQDF
jgi:Coiled-coil domain containing protein (DUF2052)